MISRMPRRDLHAPVVYVLQKTERLSGEIMPKRHAMFLNTE
jgi:hypothetical protein